MIVLKSLRQMFYKGLLLTYNKYNKMVQIDCGKYSNKSHYWSQYVCACLSRDDTEINQQTNYVGDPDKNTNGSLLIITDPRFLHEEEKIKYK